MGRKNGLADEVYWSSIRYLDTNFVHPAMVYGFEKLLMRQGRWVRDCASFESAARSICRVRRFYEWYESNIFSAYESGMGLEEYAYFQTMLKKIVNATSEAV